MKRDNIFHFKGVKQETPEEKKKRLHDEYRARYTLFRLEKSFNFK